MSEENKSTPEVTPSPETPDVRQVTPVRVKLPRVSTAIKAGPNRRK